ncbi:MAG TPA: DUF3987 domain-containing protein, partial [Mycobacterium sp.]|nr:DUF3987 domain-containing protein [Mycobacterium sp.]
GGNLSTLTVTARMARTSHIGVHAHISPEEFRAKVKDSDLAGGTYNRFLPVFVACSKFLPGSTGAPDDLVARLGTELAARLDTAGACGLIGLAPEASDTWRRLYLEFGSQEESGPVVQFTARAIPNCLRIAALYAALDGTAAITPAHLAAAAALVRYSIDSARAVFTGNTTDRLVAWIAAAGPAGRTRDEIRRGPALPRTIRAPEIGHYLDQLIEQGRITATTRPRADGRVGRPATVYTATPDG